MLTRGQVARRLGKSLATIRRLEGIELHPWQDGRGVHRFDPAEVRRVARGEWTPRPTNQHLAFRAAHTAHLESVVVQDERNAVANQTDLVPDFEPRLCIVERQLAELESERHERRASERHRQDLERENEQLCATLRTELIETLDSLSERQLRRLSAEDRDEVEELLKGR